MISALIEETCEHGKGSGRGWMRNVLSLFFLVLIGKAPGKDRWAIVRGPAGDSVEAIHRCIVAVHDPMVFMSVSIDQCDLIDFRKGLPR